MWFSLFIIIAFPISMIIYSSIKLSQLSKKSDREPSKKEETFINGILLFSNILLLLLTANHYINRPLTTKDKISIWLENYSLALICVSFIIVLSFVIYFSTLKSINKNNPSLILLYITLAFYGIIALKSLDRMLNKKGHVTKDMKDTKDESDYLSDFTQTYKPKYAFRRFAVQGRRGRW